MTKQNLGEDFRSKRNGTRNINNNKFQKQK